MFMFMYTHMYTCIYNGSACALQCISNTEIEN